MNSYRSTDNRLRRFFGGKRKPPSGRRWFFLAVWLSCVLLLRLGESGLDAQTYFGAPPTRSPGKKTATTPGGITIGGQSSTKRGVPISPDDEFDESDDVLGDMKDSRVTPGFMPNFGGGGGGGAFVQRRTRNEILQQRVEETRRREWEMERANQEILMRQRIKAEIEAVLKNLRDEYGLLDEDDSIPINLRKPTDSDDKTKTDPSPTKKSTDTANAADERKSVAQAPQKPTAGKSEEEIFNDDIKRARAEAEQTEDAEARKRTLEAVERRVQKRQEYLEKRAKDEKGANFFDIPPSLQLQERELRDGWCNLFDGKTLFGWRTQKEGPYGGGRFYVDNGELRSDPAHPGLVYTTNQFGDATLKFEYQTDEDAEVILLVRTSPNPWDLNSSAYSIVLNSADYTQPPGTILGRHTLSVDQLKKGGGRDAKSTTAVPIGKRWRRVSVLFEGTMLQVSIDKEEPVTLYEAKPLACGYVGLLVAKGNARFRNMFWSPGSTVSLFDGINPDLDWRNFKPDIVKWKPTREITLSMTGGPGVVESVKQFDNFVLQFEYNMTFTSGRSGLFFRSTPREESTGYEISIQNFPRQEDRLSTKGVDVGSFRGMKNARYVKPDDQKWNYFTLVVVDRQFQTWVNGIPVCEWSVPKDKDYIRSGTLQFLAPTDMTNVQFRNIRFAPIRQRGERAKTFEDRLQTTFAKEKESKIVADIEKRLDEEKKIEYEKTKTKK